MKKVGVLALQGDFAAHGAALARAGAEPCFVREAAQLDGLDGLVIPGGESTTMLKLLHYDGLLAPLAEFARNKPVFGTCAGAILLAREVSNPAQKGLALIDMAVERNAYGRQLDSFIAEVACPTLGGPMPAVFIRAPRIRRVGKGVEVLGSHEGEPVLVRQGNVTAATFHPELTSDRRLHRSLFGQGALDRRTA